VAGEGELDVLVGAYLEETRDGSECFLAGPGNYSVKAGERGLKAINEEQPRARTFQQMSTQVDKGVREADTRART
jgi:hypothetical protein